eukprot:4174186-Alexandrium_andersonii.AAC.1
MSASLVGSEMCIRDSPANHYRLACIRPATTMYSALPHPATAAMWGPPHAGTRAPPQGSSSVWDPCIAVHPQFGLGHMDNASRTRAHYAVFSVFRPL